LNALLEAAKELSNEKCNENKLIETPIKHIEDLHKSGKVLSPVPRKSHENTIFKAENSLKDEK